MAQKSVELTVVLPGSLAREAEAGGLLNSEALEALLREELHRRRVDRLFQAADQLANLAVPSLTDMEVEEEIQALRRTRRASNACSS